MVDVEIILKDSGVLEDKSPAWESGRYRVFMSRAGQLLGTEDALKKYREDQAEHYKENTGQGTWQAHHIFEDRELDYIGVRHKFPPRHQCLCVLIPAPLHYRINDFMEAHARRLSDMRELIEGYRFAHSLVDDYSGASPGDVAGELDRIIRTTLRHAGLISR